LLKHDEKHIASDPGQLLTPLLQLIAGVPGAVCEATVRALLLGN
jgi:hypothetical protein